MKRNVTIRNMSLRSSQNNTKHFSITRNIPNKEENQTYRIQSKFDDNIVYLIKVTVICSVLHTIPEAMLTYCICQLQRSF